ncbi:MAG TPA: glycoside hydrolase family 44 protein [Polyangiaceae bacterium]
MNSGAADEVAQLIFDGKFVEGWSDWGWGPHEYSDAGPARISFQSYGGIVLQHSPQPAAFGALRFRFHPPALGFDDFLKVSLRSVQSAEQTLPVLQLSAKYLTQLADGWFQALVPFTELAPKGGSFDRIAIEARRTVGPDWVLLDKIELTKGKGGVPVPEPGKAVTLSLACEKPALPVSSLIYGVAQGTPGIGQDGHRIGGNAMTRLNWDLGNVWNTGNDWFFENVKGSDTGIWDWFDEARTSGTTVAVVVPMIGWVAKDTSSVGFPVSKFGAQRKTDPQHPNAGDGLKPDGTPLVPLSPTTTSVPASPELIRRWIEKLAAADKQAGRRATSMYILDNEPSLWNSTHRDVHPDPVGYDELLDRTLRYGEAIREADPGAIIAGPAEWGWPAYFSSARDNGAPLGVKTDQLAHGGVALLPWYLRKLAAYQRDNGKRLLDVLDVHFYPQGVGVYGDGAKTDPAAAALRIRSTRALWDESYLDESWIKDRVNLIPRMKAWIAENYPGLGLSLGEWSFGADTHISGGLAIAESLGRFAQGGLRSAFYWGKLAPASPGYLAFKAYRDFDGKGGHFLEWSLPTQGTRTVSLFGSRDSSSARFVLVVLNLDPVVPVVATIDIAGCGRPTAWHVYGFGPDSKAIEDLGAKEFERPGKPPEERVPPYSVRIIAFDAKPAE